MRRAEGLVGGVVLLAVAALALLLSGCENYDATFKARRAAAFSECETYCRATPLAVKFDRNGSLLECRCDIVFSEVE